MPLVNLRRRPWLDLGRSALCLCLFIAVHGCGGNDSTSGGGPGDHARGQRPGGGRPEEPAVPIAVQLATTGDIASYYDATASLEAEKQAEVLARVAGVIESLDCEEGDQLDAGDPLLRIDNDEYLLRMRQAEASRANLQSRYERLQAMIAEELVTEEEFQAARSELATAESEEGLARLNLSYTTVTAPFAGKVVQRMVDIGQNVSVGTPLFMLADFEPLLARVHVPSREFKKLKPDQPVTLVLDSNRERMHGRIKLISPVIDATSGTIKITVEIPSYPAGTRPGDFAEVQIVTESRIGSILVPKGAVISDKGEDVVYLAIDGKAERRSVEVGFVDDQNSEIIAGIQPGDPVVVKGQRSLEHGAAVKILEGDGAVAATDSSAAPAGSTSVDGDA